MHPYPPRASWDIYLLGVPLVAILFCCYFRVDEVFTSKRPAKRRLRVHGIDPEGQSMRTDPDGRPWQEG